MTIEDLILQAQDRQADRAVPVERIRAGLAARIARARRRRRIGLGAGAGLVAASVAAAIVIPSVLIDRDRHRPVSTPPMTPSANDVPLGFRPTWLPDDLVERGRNCVNAYSPLAPEVTRQWDRPDAPLSPRPTLSFKISRNVADPQSYLGNAAERIVVNGAEGTFRRPPEDMDQSLVWSPGKHTLLTLETRHSGLDKEDLLRIAQSVVPSPDRYTTPLRFQKLPSGWRVVRSQVEGSSPKDWKSVVWVQAAGGSRTETVVRIEIGASAFGPDDGTELTIGGRPARTLLSGPTRYLVVELGGGRLMSLQAWGDAAELDLLSTVATDTVVTGAGVDWLGTR